MARATPEVSILMEAQATMETGRRGAQSMGSGSNESIQEGFLEGMTSE